MRCYQTLFPRIRVCGTRLVLAYSNGLFAASADAKVSIETLEGAAAFGTLPTFTPSHRLRVFSQETGVISTLTFFTLGKMRTDSKEELRRKKAYQHFRLFLKGVKALWQHAKCVHRVRYICRAKQQNRPLGLIKQISSRFDTF